MFDIVTVCTGLDLNNIQVCIKGLKENLQFNKIYIITNNTSLVPCEDNVVAIDENDIVSADLANELKNMNVPFFPKRFGWYYQQFLKIEFSRSKYCDSDYLIWDADTILLKPIVFMDNGNYLYTQGNEVLNKPYVDTFKTLLGLDYYYSTSMISQHLYVNRNVMINMINDVEIRHGKCFSIAVLESLQGDTPSLFSEYETYINYHAAKNINNIQTIERVWFRNAAAICGFNAQYSELKAKFKSCDFVALEKFDLTFKGKLKAYLKYLKFLLN